MKNLKEFCKELETDIQSAYESSVTMERAERLAAKFLGAQMMLVNQLQVTDLDARMKKSGTKALRAEIYHTEATKTEKKPSDAFLASIVDQCGDVRAEQEEFDVMENRVEYLCNLLNVCKEAHVYFRGIAKGSFNG